MGVISYEKRSEDGRYAAVVDAGYVKATKNVTGRTMEEIEQKAAEIEAAAKEELRAYLAE